MPACCEDIDFPEHSSDPEDPRQAGKVLYPLDEIPDFLFIPDAGDGIDHRFPCQI